MIAILIFILFFASPVFGATYWASPSGGAGTCAAASGTSDPGVYRTLSQGLACLASGDTLRLIAGTYTGGISASNIPNGPGSGVYTTVRGAGVGQTILSITGGNNCFIYWGATHTWIEIRDLECRGNNGAGNNGVDLAPSSSASNLKFTNFKANEFRSQGFISGPLSSLITLTNVEFGFAGINGTCPQLPGEGYCHGIYSSSNNLTVEGCSLHNNDGIGVQFYETAQNTVMMRNCIVYNNLTSGIFVGGAVTNAKIYNNTSYNNSLGTGVHIDSGAVNAEAKNNIALNNGNAQVTCLSGTCSNNTTTGTATNIWVNPATADFHLKTGSSAIGAGANLGADVPTDRDGLTRPQGGTWDTGAYEFVEAGGAPSAPRSPIIIF